MSYLKKLGGRSGRVGPGGIHCPCCVSGKRRDVKRRMNRGLRRKLLRELLRLCEEEV